MIFNPINQLDNSKKGNSLTTKEIVDYNDHRKFGYKPILCYAPLTSLYFRINGDVLACCRNTQDILGNIQRDSLEDIWNSGARKQLIEKINNQQLEGSCGYCHKQLKTGNYSALLANMYDPIFGDTADYPTDITFEISNTCNLECIMCSGDFSSSIRKNRDLLPALPNAYPEHFADQLKPFLKKIKVARFQGGEPFLITEYLDIIEYIGIFNPSSIIYIQTNGTVLNNRVLNILQNKNVHISISLDAITKERYERIRKNAQFDKVMEHIRFFRKHNKQININFCLMNNNWMEIPAMIDYCLENNFTLTIIPVEFPFTMNISTLPIVELFSIKETFIKNKMSSNNVLSNTSYQSIIHLLEGVIHKKLKETEYNETITDTSFLLQEVICYISAKLSTDYGLLMNDIILNKIKDLPEIQQKALLVRMLENMKIAQYDKSILSEPVDTIHRKISKYIEDEITITHINKIISYP